MTRARIIGTAVLLSILVIGWSWMARRPGPASPPRTAIPARSAAEWYELGRHLATVARDLPGAIVAYREALALDPQQAEAHYGLGLALLQSGDAEGAAAEIESALSLAPADASWRPDAENAMVHALLRKSNDKPQ